MSDFTLSQRKALSIVPHITGFMSLTGSGFIVTEILRDRKKQGQVYHRLILGMASVDILVTGLGFSLSTWPMPRDTEYVYNAAGNEATCRMQGFVIALSLSGPLYNLALATYYLLVIGYSKKERQLRVTERWMHFLALSCGFGVAIAGLCLDLYHSAGLWCAIAPRPCDAGDADCSPEDNHHHIYRWAFLGVPIWLAIFVVTGIMITIYLRVRRQELISRKWRPGATSAAKRLTHQVAVQATWYVTAFYITWIWPTITRAIEAFGGVAPYALVFLSALLLPLQGAINFCVYMRPRFEQFRRAHPELSVVAIMGKTCLKTLCVCKRHVADDMDDDMNPALKVGQLYVTTAGHNIVSVLHKRSMREEAKMDFEADNGFDQ